LELTLSPTGAVTLKCAQDINVETQGAAIVKATSVTLDTPETNLTGNLTVTGATTLAAITSNGKDISSTHRHANSGGPGTGGVPV
jgi:phage baseplate assembly protein gpV